MGIRATLTCVFRPRNTLLANTIRHDFSLLSYDSFIMKHQDIPGILVYAYTDIPGILLHLL